MPRSVRDIEKEAQRLLEERSYQEASELFYEAAIFYRNEGHHQPAAISFASAASCLALQFGEKTYYHTATVYEKAARAAAAAGDLEYASVLYKQAAIFYERDMEYLGFSDCFFRSKECYRRFLTLCLFRPDKIRRIQGAEPASGLKPFLKRAISWLTMTFSSFVWGHGERPQRTVLFGVFIILVASLLYTQGHVVKDGTIVHPSLWEAFYFSVITFTTVGYGDIIPVGLNRGFVIMEAFCGLFTIPIFITALCRKYLRY